MVFRSNVQGLRSGPCLENTDMFVSGPRERRRRFPRTSASKEIVGRNEWDGRGLREDLVGALGGFIKRGVCDHTVLQADMFQNCFCCFVSLCSKNCFNDVTLG